MASSSVPATVGLPLETRPSEERPRGYVSATRYRPPGDVLRLITAGAVLVVSLVASILAGDRLVGSNARVFDAISADTTWGRLLTGLVQVGAIGSAVAIAAAALYRRRFRLLATLAGGAAAAALASVAVDQLVGRSLPEQVSDNLATDSFLFPARFPGTWFFAGSAALVVAVGPWLSRPWRRTAWLALGLAALARVITGTALPMDMVLALAVGAVVAGALLVAFGAPDRRIGPTEIAAGLAAGGLPVRSVHPAKVAGRGSRPFVATTTDGRALFVKVLGQDERDADLLYRAYRFARLQQVGDARPAASLRQAVEHQALVGLIAEQGGVHVPHVDRVALAADGSVLLAMDAIDGRPLEQLSADQISDDLLGRLWRNVDRLHGTGIAHRSLRSANVMVDHDGQPSIVDFSFSELVATDRQIAVDVAELLASLAVLVGPDRAVASAVDAIGADRVAPAVRLLQPLALSAATRRTAGRDELLGRTRTAAAAASGEPLDQLAQVQRVQPRTLLMIAAAAGAFYFLLPQLAQVSDSWRAFQSANFAWLPLVIAMSILTYLGSGIAILGAVPQPLAFGPTVLAQMASSFVNRVTPAGVGGMVLSTRYLQKSGVDPATAVAGVGLNSAAGAVVHVVLLVIFFLWSGSALGRAFKLPSGSRLLVIVAVLFALAGALLVTRWGRKRLLAPVLRGVRSSVTNLRRLATSPSKLALLFGGSLVTTLAYICAFAASVAAFGGGISIAKVGAVYLGAAALAAAAPTPGNLGAIEAALVAGLTGVGMAAGPAVSAVLTYRLATYWLPIVPGWISWNLVQRRQFI